MAGNKISGQSLHAEAVRFYQERGMISQKDLARRRGFMSVRSVQRFRKRYNLAPSGYWGVNPLFAIADVERAEALETKRTSEMLKSKMRLVTKASLLSHKAARRRAREARK